MKPGDGNHSDVLAASRMMHANVRTGLGTDAIAEALVDNLHYLQAKLPQHATRNDWYMALAYTVRDRLLDGYIRTVETIAGAHTKVVAYLSAEFLTGPHLGNSLIGLGITRAVQEALSGVDQDLASLLEQEEEPGLGNGGLGRLAACYMDSLATAFDTNSASSIRRFEMAGRLS
jgi:glycogen phosphorylase